jgi:uncharacterized 2Fe-2S/4Fe-4S cluster protein (DUF4445 family)
MRKKEYKVTFANTNTSVYVLEGTVLMEAAARAELVLQTPCGGRGTCGKCKVRIVSGNAEASATERDTLGADAITDGYRLACQTRVYDNLAVEVPVASLFNKSLEILAAGTDTQVPLKPTVRKTFFELTPPDRDNPVSDLSRLRTALGPLTVSSEVLRMIPSFLRAHDWQGTAVISNDHLIALEKGRTCDRLYGVAFDIGTTTIVGALVDLNSGREIATASCINPQTSFGDDVLSRIAHVRDNPHTLSQLQSTVITAINRIIAQLVQKARISTDVIYELVVAGNTTMQQICCGYDPSALGELPFTPVFDAGQRVHASHVGITIHPEADIYVFGQIGGYIGGDTLACMVSSRIDTWEKPVLLVDIGTNGEIVLARTNDLFATSTAAGPAFEGGKIGQGMRGTVGAIEKVLINDEVAYNVIGDTRAVGICGSGLIDAAAQLRRAGLIDMMGRLCTRDEAPDTVSDAVKMRLVPDENEQSAFVLVPGEESGLDGPVMLTQNDIRELQLAAGAIRAGISVLLRRAEITVEELDTILLAGAFGAFIRRSSALDVGMLPAVPKEKIKSIGNAALSGAKLALISLQEREYGEALREKTRYIDLSMDRDFNEEFGMAMMFPGLDGETAPM